MTGNVRKQAGKRPVNTPKHRWKNGKKMDLKETGWVAVDCVNLCYDRDNKQPLVSTVVNFQMKQNVGNLLISSGTTHF